MASTNVAILYRSIIDDVINNVRETFLDDGVDEQVLLELKQVWESKMAQSKALPSENDSRETEGSTSVAAETVAKSNSRVSVVSTAASAVGATTAAISVSTNVAATSTAAVTSTAPTVQYHYTNPTGQPGHDAPKTVTITLPSQSAAPGQKPVTITLPAHLVQNPQGGIIMSASAASAAQALPAGIAAGLLQSQLTRVITQQDGSLSYQTLTTDQLAKQGYMVSMAPRAAVPTIVPSTTASTASSSTGQVQPGVIQLDGLEDTSDDDDDDDDLRDDDNDPDDDDDKLDDNEGAVEEEVDSDPLNSEDDVSDDDPSELFDTDNVIVCQYDKITRSRNKWKFHLKDGIMSLQGKDYVFQKAIGDAEW